jgi:hypothetical protein
MGAKWERKGSERGVKGLERRERKREKVEVFFRKKLSKDFFGSKFGFGARFQEFGEKLAQIFGKRGGKKKVFSKKI